MSKKYINADALLNHLYSHQDEQPDIAKVIAEFDAADVVEVVRCKDCRYMLQSEGCALNRDRFMREEEDYCSYGEREDG